jgi:hypothetical protein
LKEDLERKTVKNYQSILSNNNISNLPPVNIDLPKELQEQLVYVNTNQIGGFNTTPQDIIARPYNVDNNVPYGCLKGGLKPSYKDWNKTQKNMIVTDPKLSVVVDSNVVSDRENRLNKLKSKIKEKQIITPQIENNVSNTVAVPANTVVAPTNTVITPEITEHKQILKRTIRKKYTLGKTKNNRSVGVLIKDRNTRKQVLTAQRELKKKSINDIKTYLKDHNLIKVGSNAPNDVIRKMYEASMLAGEITNSNSDILLHNLLKDDKEL